MLRVKELKEILKECDDNSFVYLEYFGNGIEVEPCDIFTNIDSQDVEINTHSVTIGFS